jgi:hypothetical protein
LNVQGGQQLNATVDGLCQEHTSGVAYNSNNRNLLPKQLLCGNHLTCLALTLWLKQGLITSQKIMVSQVGLVVNPDTAALFT